MLVYRQILGNQEEKQKLSAAIDGKGRKECQVKSTGEEMEEMEVASTIGRPTTADNTVEKTDGDSMKSEALGSADEIADGGEVEDDENGVDDTQHTIAAYIPTFSIPDYLERLIRCV